MRPLPWILFPVALAYQLTAGPLYAVSLGQWGRVDPDLLLVAGAVHAVRSRTTPGALVPALAAGAAADALSADPFLTRTLGYGFLAIVGSACGRRGLAENGLARFAHMLAALAAGAGASAVWLASTGHASLVPTLESALGTWTYHAALGLALLELLAPFDRTLPRREAARRTDPGGVEWYAGV